MSDDGVADVWRVLASDLHWWTVEVPPMTGPPLPRAAQILCGVCERPVRVVDCYEVASART